MVLAVVILFKLPGQTVGKFKLAIASVFLPLFGLAGSAHSLSDRAASGAVSKSQLEAQNEALRHENDQLRLEVARQQDLARDDARLRALVGWPHPAGWKLKLARVIARDPSNWWRSLQIDLGRRDGMAPNLAVMTSAGLVGKIQSVGETRSQVTLLGDPSLRVAAKINETGETGIIVAGSSTPQENNMVDMTYLSGASGVSPGQAVVTWGGGGVFSNGIPIGRVVDQWKQEQGLTTEARVLLWANINSLQEVWVMMP